jgi:zinc and cadmium transporter
MVLTAFLLSGLLVGPGGVLAAVLILRLPESLLERVTPRILSFATGALLGMVFLRMLPRAVELGQIRPVLALVLAAILGLFLLERLNITRHCHERKCPEHADMGVRIFAGNAAHNLVDGMALALAFQASLPMGWLMTLAILGHEIPKSLVNLLLMRESSDHTTAVLWVGLASLFTVFGGLLTLLAAQLFLDKIPYLLALGAAVFLYMALADLVPRHRRKLELGEALTQSGAVLLGAALVFGLSR